MVSAVYPLSPPQAAAVAGGALLNLDPDKLLVPNLVQCLDCDQPYADARMTPCPAEDEYTDLSWPAPNPNGAS